MHVQHPIYGESEESCQTCQSLAAAATFRQAMSLYNGPARGGNRGGKDQFNWESVKSDRDREYYLGHSVKAVTGRWQNGEPACLAIPLCVAVRSCPALLLAGNWFSTVLQSTWCSAGVSTAKGVQCFYPQPPVKVTEM